MYAMKDSCTNVINITKRNRPKGIPNSSARQYLLPNDPEDESTLVEMLLPMKRLFRRLIIESKGAWFNRRKSPTCMLCSLFVHELIGVY